VTLTESDGYPAALDSVLVIILRLGSHEISEAMTESLAKLRSEVPVVVVVVAENPNGESVVEFDEPMVDQVVRLQSNVGYAAAVNAAAKTVLSKNSGAAAGTLLIMTDDVVVRSGTLATLVAASGRSGVGVAAPVVCTEGEEWVGGTWNTKWGWARHQIRTASAPLSQPSGADTAWVTTWADGACLAIKRDLFDLIGGFDERTFLYSEDLLFCLQSLQHGERVVVVPAVAIEQQSGMTKRSGAHGYLLIRNEILAMRTVSNSFAIAAVGTGLFRCALELGRAFVHRQRRHHLLQSFGMGWGIFDALRHRYGPPPTRLAQLANIPMIERSSNRKRV
jgi:GT2 family glycosyltransferase